MIQANELRIGNWLFGMFNTNDGFLQQPLEISPDVISEIYDGVGDYSPIPITEEWLLRFGMEEALNGWWCKDEVFSYREGYAGLGTNRWTQIQYVHQLQNLYFGLTGQELTINEQ